MNNMEHYIEIGAIEIEGVDETGELVLSISERAKDIAPELWAAHVQHIDETLLELYKSGYMDVEYDEDLEPNFKLSDEGIKIAKEMGLIPMDKQRNIPNN